MAEWLTAMLRGEQRPVYRSLERIAELATDHIGNRSPHWFVAAGYRDGVPWYAQITNATLDGGAEQEFDLRIQELRSGETGLSVAPHPSVIPESDLRTLWKVNRLESGPRDPEEFLDLLAAVTRRTSEAGDPTVSASCSTVYLPPECEPARGKTHGASLMEGPQKMAIGVDLSEVGRLLVQRTRAMKEDDDFEEEEWERRHAEAAERMDTPESDDE